MSNRWPNGIVNKTFTPPTTGLVPSASGIWNMQTQADYQATGGWPNQFTAIEDVFSTYLYTGTGSSQTITNGIDLAGKGGLVWFKQRNNVNEHALFDSTRNTRYYLSSNMTNGNMDLTGGSSYLAFNSNGYSLSSGGYGVTNESGSNYASWTFREAPKFFDVVTYTGDGTNGRTLNHNLGIQPGMIIIKCTSASSGWAVRHSYGNPLLLNTTDAAGADATFANGYASIGLSTASTFYVYQGAGADVANVNASGATYVAYLFAHDTTTNGLIQCGSFTTDASKNFSPVNLGWEPQYLLVKRSDSATGGNWLVMDTMRGLGVGASSFLYPNLENAEAQNTVGFLHLTSTGFQNSTTPQVQASATYIYMAIRRGPMKTPTDGTKVFKPVVASGGTTMDIGFPSDMAISGFRDGGSSLAQLNESRLTKKYLSTSSTAAEGSANLYQWDKQNQLLQDGTGGNFINYAFQRAPSFFDVVCYTGTGVARTVNHNLAVAPELLILKKRNAAWNWRVYSNALGNGSLLYLDLTNASDSTAGWDYTSPTSTGFTVSAAYNSSNDTYVAYLFASCPGVSKVGSYTGTGSTQTISCGFTGGARFVLIKRTDSTGDWYVWDTARGMTAGTDPSLLLNSTAAEVNANSVYTTTGGFQIVSTAAGINASGGSYIFLAVA